MSDSQQIDIHSIFVQTWEKDAASGLTSVQQVRLLENAIRVVERRACLTLSNITLLVILDRVLHNSKEKFPTLAEISIESNSLNFFKLHNFENNNLVEAIDGLRYLLIELLKVLSRITADILTIPLHNELLKVTWNEPEKK
jgi:hypothetical protein